MPALLPAAGPHPRPGVQAVVNICQHSAGGNQESRTLAQLIPPDPAPEVACS
jgi:hypothetical protein